MSQPSERYLAFTGHRPSDLPGRTTTELEACRPSIARALADHAHQATTQGTRLRLRSSAASGADLIAIEEASKLGIPIHLILPLPPQEFTKDFSGSAEDDLPRALHFITKAQGGGDGWTIDTIIDHDRPHCYEECNRRLLRGASMLIAVWDGRPADGPGGVESAIRTAGALQIETILIRTRTAPHRR